MGCSISVLYFAKSQKPQLSQSGWCRRTPLTVLLPIFLYKYGGASIDFPIASH